MTLKFDYQPSLCYHGLMKIFKDRICTQCAKSYIPTSGIQKVCLDCRRDYRNKKSRLWSAENRERDHANRKEWYWNNLEKLRNIKRKWNNSEKGIAYRTSYYLEHKDKMTKVYDKYTENEGSRIKARRLYIKAGLPLICDVCKDITKKVQIHHVDGNALNNGLNNLIALCVRDHKDLHRRKRLELDQNRAS